MKFEETESCEVVYVLPGEWIRPPMKGYRMHCCDCGLVHRVDFCVIDEDNNVVKGLRVLLRAWKHEGETKKARKRRNITINH